MPLIAPRLEQMFISSSYTSVIWSPVPQLDFSSISRVHHPRLLGFVRGACREKRDRAASFWPLSGSSLLPYGCAAEKKTDYWAALHAS
jgi:hypothetical protein